MGTSSFFVKTPQELFEQFENRSLPKTEWTHEAHLSVGLTYVYHYPKNEALCYLRSGIIAYNLAVGTPNTPTEGYHETLTIFWLEVLNAYSQKHPQPSLSERIHHFMKSPRSRRDLALDYYSRERLFSLEARARWVEPDQFPFDF